MKAVILAAGIGSRLRPITNEKPKTLVKVNNKPMLGYLLEALLENEIYEVIICVGFKSEQVINYCESEYPQLKFKFVENREFDETNNMYSLFLAKDYLNDDILLMNADLIIDKDIIKKLIQDERKNLIAVDRKNYFEESMKVLVKDKKIKRISKEISKNDAYGTSIDIYKIYKKEIGKLINEMKKIIEIQKNKNQWTEVMLDNLFKNDILETYPCDISNYKWMEIDNYEDLYKAELLFNNKINKISDKKIFFIDRDGTLTLGDKLIEGSLDFLDYLRRNNKIFYILTNNSSKTPKEHLNKFNKLRLNLNLNNVLVSTQSAVNYLIKNNLKDIFWVANKSVSKFLKDCGLKFNNKNPQAILLTYDDEINYSKFVDLVKFIREGLPYYATHMDIVCPTDNGFVPDIGTFIKVIEMTTGITPNKIFGKPYKDFILPVLKKHNLTLKDALIIGDRLYTDIQLAINCKIDSVLVFSGETKREDYENSPIRADILVPKIYDLLKFF